jgi:hypothetical protein
VWQAYWQGRGHDFDLVAVAQDVQGRERVAALTRAMQLGFPVLIDRTSELGRLLGFRIVPSGVFVDAEGIVRYRHTDDFDIADPRVRVNLDNFLAGRAVEHPAQEDRMETHALELFARGVSEYSHRDATRAAATWREALEHDPDNFVIRSQIWALEHPEHFYPVVDREWQALQLLKEGYDKPLP